MKPNLDKWSIVIAGAWNIRLFTPDWLSQNILKHEGSSGFQIEMGIGTGIRSWRFIAGDFIFSPGEDKFIFSVKSATLENLKECEMYAQRLLELLPHTPIAGIGINLCFTSDEPSAKLTKLFDLSDNKDVSSCSLQFDECTIARSFKVPNSNQRMNASISLVNKVVELDFNHHVAANTAQEGIGFLTGTKVIEAFERTSTFLKDVYEMELTTTEEEDRK
jgi:hypothetical protein